MLREISLDELNTFQMWDKHEAQNDDRRTMLKT